MLEGARGASGYERFAARAARCEAALYELEERIKILSIVQRKWVYLEPVYGGGAAPSDSGRWTRADKEFRYNSNYIKVTKNKITIHNAKYKNTQIRDE